MLDDVIIAKELALHADIFVGNDKSQISTWIATRRRAQGRLSLSAILSAHQAYSMTHIRFASCKLYNAQRYRRICTKYI